MKKPRKKTALKQSAVRLRKGRKRGTTFACPKCGAPSRVLRTTLGARLRVAARDHVLRERRCVGKGGHRFATEERAR